MTQSAAQEAALSAEQSAREELKGVLDQQKLGAQREKEALLMQVRATRSYVYGVLFGTSMLQCQLLPYEFIIKVFKIQRY